MWDWLGWLVVLVFVLVVIRARVKKRGFFWKAKDGEKLSFKQFLKRWAKGVEGITPLQQTANTLWSFPLILGGLVTGVVISIINRQWWLVLVLIGSLPPTLMSLVSSYQKFIALRKVKKAMEELNK